ncbi:hypothetical protein GCM10010220_11180 [Streptomyces parvulus]|nr:hypothetical protein GCM10010220_11180 [Streptomyces parvulus]
MTAADPRAGAGVGSRASPPVTASREVSSERERVRMGDLRSPGRGGFTGEWVFAYMDATCCCEPA